MEPRYAVVALPALARADSVEAIRRRFDPQAGLLGAHVTLVFPFRGDLDEAGLRTHVRRAAVGARPFTITLSDLSMETGGYLFLRVGAGAESFHDLHTRLYSGPLTGHRSSAHAYLPHVTIGRLADHAELAQAREQADRALALPVLGAVTGLAIFRLDDPERGAIVWSLPFEAADGGHPARGMEPSRDGAAVSDRLRTRRR